MSAPGQTNILLGVACGLRIQYIDDPFFYTHPSCEINTFKTTQQLALSEPTKELLTEVAKLPIKSVISGVSLGTNSQIAKFIFDVGGYFLEISGSNQKKADSIIYFGSKGADSLFSKLIGDYLSLPASQITEEIIRQQVAEHYNDRDIWYFSTNDAPVKDNFSEEVNLSFMYDPKTHITSGVFTSHCAPSGYYFIFDTDTKTGYPIGEMQIFNISLDKWIGP